MDKFTRMIMGARKADPDSIRELKNYIYEQSGVANKSLRALEKAGITEYAYGRAYTFLNTEYQSIKFPQAVAHRDDNELKSTYIATQNTSQSREKSIWRDSQGRVRFPQATLNRDTQDLIKQALELHRFLSSPTRTVRGAKAARQAQIRGIEMLNRLGYHIPTDPETLTRVSRTLGNDGLRFSGTVRYEIMEAIADAFENDKTDEEVQLIMNRYASGDILYDRTLQELRGV